MKSSIPFLKPNDLIGICCPSGYVAYERVSYAQKVLKDWGYEVLLGHTVGNAYHYFSGDDATRAQDLQMMLDHPDIKAIIMGRGGYGLSRIIDQLDFSRFSMQPKWICGFSDITVLHSHIQAQYALPTLHSVMCGAFSPETEFENYIYSFKAALTGETLFYQWQPQSYNRLGYAEAEVVGGNLAILSHLTGSVSQINTDGKILFIEDIGEHLYQIDRMLLNLKRSGQLAHLAGLMIGNFSDVQDTERPFGQSLEALILDKVAAYNYPVAFGFACGHEKVNYSLFLGMPSSLEVSQEKVCLHNGRAPYPKEFLI